MGYQLYLRGKKLKHYALRHLNELRETGGRHITGGCHPAIQWMVRKGLVVQSLTTPPNYWKVEYEYSVTDAGRSWAEEHMPYQSN